MESTITIRAVYENGVIRLLEPVDLEEGQEVEVIASKQQNSRQGKRIMGLHEGAAWMSDDFDDPLPDSFWLGEDSQ